MSCGPLSHRSFLFPVLGVLAVPWVFSLSSCSDDDNAGPDSGTDGDTDADADTDTDADGDSDSDTETGTETSTECVCTEGECCDGCNYLPPSVQCGTTAEAFEFDCASAECGADLLRRGVFRFCSGSAAGCGADNLQPGLWETWEICGGNQLCTMATIGAHCVDCPGGCEAGACEYLDCAPSFTPHAVVSGWSVGRGLSVADIDGDGRKDLLSVTTVNSEDLGRIFWWKSPTGGGEWVNTLIAEAFGQPTEARAIDFDHDGDFDVVAASGGGCEIAWFENTAGDGTAWIEHLIAETENGGALKIDLADVDDDGDVDVVGGENMTNVRWWENADGEGLTWTAHVVDEAFSAYPIYSADLDGDGDGDVIAGGPFNDGITWWENADGDGSTWIEHPIVGSGSLYYYSIHTADIDGDGDQDIAVADGGSNEVKWWENALGDGSEWIEREVMGSYTGNEPRDIEVADLDGDGDPDLIVTPDYTNDGAVWWWENIAGDGSAWEEHILGFYVPSWDNERYVVAGDLDGDLDLDVATAVAGSDGITWWENHCIDLNPEQDAGVDGGTDAGVPDGGMDAGK